MTTDSAAHALFEQVGRTGIITLNRPERLNALTARMQSELIEHLKRCNSDPGIGAIVITGAGRGFCSGVDLRERAAGDGEGALVAMREMTAAMPALFKDSKPLIAAVNGVGVGFGLTLPLVCDIRIASEEARFSARFVRVGLTPELGSSFFLPQIVGIGRAVEMVLTARWVDAAEALSLGLVTKVVPTDKLREEALALAAEISASPSQALRWSKRLLYTNATNSDTEVVLLLEQELIQQAHEAPAAQEAARAFAEKREPNFLQFER